MSRPFISNSLAELTQLQVSDSSVDTQLAILHELGYRKTKGARNLATRIQEKLETTHRNIDIELSLPNSENKSKSNYVAEPTPAKPRQDFVNFTPSKPKFPLTSEQSEAVNLFGNDQTLKITAFAGTGKTSTLVAMAGTTPKRGIYLAFNKSIATEAQSEFPSQTDCRTTHSVARRLVQSSYKFSNQKMFNKIGPKQLSEELELKEKAISGKFTLNGVQQAHMF